MRFLVIFTLSLYFSIAIGQDFDDIEVRFEKNNYVLYNVETSEKITKLCSSKKSILKNGTRAIWALNWKIVGVASLKKDQEIFTIYNSKNKLEQQFSYIQRINTTSGFIPTRDNREFIVERFPYFTAIPFAGGSNFGAYGVDGSELIPPKYNAIEIYHIDKDKQAYFCVKDLEKGYGMYYGGELIIPARYAYIEPIELDYFIPISSFSSNGVYNIAGELLVNLYPHEIQYNSDTTLTIYSDGLVGLLDKDAQIMIPFEYTSIEKKEDKKYWIEIDGRKGIYDLDSQKVIAFLPTEVALENPSLAYDENEDIFSVVEIMPEFPGGESAMYSFIAKNVIYPQIAIDNDIEGKVYLEFTVDKTGVVSNAKVIRGVDPFLDKAALDVINAFPNFIPGYQKGKPVNVRYRIPISFKLR